MLCRAVPMPGRRLDQINQLRVALVVPAGDQRLVAAGRPPTRGAVP